MWFPVKFNWALQIDINNAFSDEGIHKFKKVWNRFFPIKTPIDLIDMSRTAIAKINIIEYTNRENEVSGKYEIIKKYHGDEQKILIQYWIENQ